MQKASGFILFASLLLATQPTSGADVSNYTLAKGKVYNQANAAGPTPKNNVARFFAIVDLTQTGSVTNATVQYLPSGTVNPLTVGGGGGPGGQNSLSYQPKFRQPKRLRRHFARRQLQTGHPDCARWC